MQLARQTASCGRGLSVARSRPFTSARPARLFTPAIQALKQDQEQRSEPVASKSNQSQSLEAAMLTAFTLLTVVEPAAADTLANPFSQSVTANSLYVTLALFLMSVPGIWSQVKRAPKANKKRKTYEVPGPAVEGAMSLKDRAKQIVIYFKKYNYEVKEMGEVITFAGLYKADKGQAAAVTFYTFIGMGSVALVLSLLVPDVGNWWYLLTLFAPAAYAYYMQKGERVEEVRVKMVSTDDDRITDITIEGDIEEINRFRKELNLVEKGMVPVKGILEA